MVEALTEKGGCGGSSFCSFKCVWLSLLGGEGGWKRGACSARKGDGAGRLGHVSVYCWNRRRAEQRVMHEENLQERWGNWRVQCLCRNGICTDFSPPAPPPCNSTEELQSRGWRKAQTGWLYSLPSLEEAEEAWAEWAAALKVRY